MTPASGARVRFGAFEFAPATGELWMDGRRVKLQQQPSRLLDLLVARPGEVVSREEMRLALWGHDTHVDFERSLNFCVGKLRSALRDNAASPRFVETVPTRGYRFIATVTATESRGRLATDCTDTSATDRTDHTDRLATDRTDHADRLATESTESTDRLTTESTACTEQTVGSADRRVWIVAGAVLALVVAALAFWQHRSVVSTPTLVVVPFHNETGSPDLDRVAKGVSDAAVARLATPERLAHLLVIGNASNLPPFSFRPANMKALGESLGAQYLLLTAAMVGQLALVKGWIEAIPGVQRNRGPHGISLLAHARSGGPAAAETLKYLESLGDADPRYTDLPVTDADQATIIGEYSFGPGPTERLKVAKNARGALFIQRTGQGERGLSHQGGLVFIPAGAEAVKIRFETHALLVEDGALVMRAKRG